MYCLTVLIFPHATVAQGSAAFLSPQKGRVDFDNPAGRQCYRAVSSNLSRYNAISTRKIVAFSQLGIESRGLEHLRKLMTTQLALSLHSANV